MPYLAMPMMLWQRTKRKLLPLLLTDASHRYPTRTNASTIAVPCSQYCYDDTHNTYSAIFQDVITLCKQGRLNEAIQTLYSIDHRYVWTDSYVYDVLLQSCLGIKALPEGKLVHTHIILTGFNHEINVGTKLVTMYAKYGDLQDGRRVLEEMPEQNVVSWTALISAFSRQGHAEEALGLFNQMQQRGVQPNEFTFASLLPACATLGALEQGKEVHEDAIRNGIDSDVFVGNALVNMYAKCRNIEDARKVFDKIPKRKTVSWNSMIAGYIQNGSVVEALELFDEMPERDVRTWTSMIAGYAQYGYIEEAMELFQKMPERNAVSWNVMIAGLVRNGYHDDALNHFRQMGLVGVKPDLDTFASVLPAYAGLANIREGREVHEEIKRRGFQSDVFVGSALVDMYAKCGSMEDARDVFDKMPVRDVVSWTALVVGYACNGDIDEAAKLFQKMSVRNLVSWNAMIAGYAHNGHMNEALKLFQLMQLTGVKPNMDTFASILPVCANVGALHRGMEAHEDIVRRGYHTDVFVGSALVDMYAKCGSIEDAQKVFYEMSSHDTVSWTAMIVGYAIHGYGLEALQLFDEMRYSGTKPDRVAFVGILSACCHTGQVDDAWRYFNCMSRDYNIVPTMEHYCCMVDLLGRTGQLDEAQEFINKMPIKPDAAVWGSLLGACKNHANTELGEYVAERLVESDPTNAAHYVLLSNIYAVAGRWNKVDDVRRMMKERKVKKVPGSSWIELNNKVHVFVVGDRSHPQTQKIYTKLEILSGQIKEAGYAPDTNFVLHDVEEEQKDHIIHHHSEKLAIVFGLINTSPGTPIRIVKNLRVCGDCHSATKFICKIVSREIIVRDASRFHHFNDGRCSCGDYW